MSDFNYVQDFVYDPAGTQINNSIAGGSLADEDNDDQFETGDQTFSTNDYVGTITVGGIEMPVFQRPDGSHHVYNPGPGWVTPPASFPGATPGAHLFCFAAGTRISTPDGTAAVEDLTIGDDILTEDGRCVLVKWIGRQTVRTAFAASKRQLVRLRAGSLGHGLPNADLTVTADHGMVLDGYVINASALVNGDSINWVQSAELGNSYTVYHVETEAHDVILANGAPSETFIDYADRRAFDNYLQYLDLYGAERVIPEMARPRISARRQLPLAIRDRLGVFPTEDLALTA
ncbi:Hint domain-containing protein [Antarctobacter jejuensis]|uniref:Hint domain-containing protein n=1 Tax=Antarctobacter jejuensis TaxID=1439938 RepID=UPI003FD0F827